MANCNSCLGSIQNGGFKIADKSGDAVCYCLDCHQMVEDLIEDGIERYGFKVTKIRKS